MSIFLMYLSDVDNAVASRDALRITALLRKRIATHVPRDVREELLAFSRRSRDSHRAPVQFLRFQHRISQLADGGEPMMTAQGELALGGTESRSTAGAARRRDGERRSAAANPAKEPDSADATDSPRQER
ncbi:MAG: hypothetical protein ABI442_09410 [Gemmatimonadaceae bacterium]